SREFSAYPRARRRLGLRHRLRRWCGSLRSPQPRHRLRARAARGPPDRETPQELLMTLEIYPVILQLVARVAPHVTRLRSRSPSLGDQLERALTSIPLNTAEGSYSRGKNRLVRYQSAAASAREALACCETAQ